MTPELTVTLVHALPGRLRLRLSFTPRDTERFLDAIGAHDGLEAINSGGEKPFQLKLATPRQRHAPLLSTVQTILRSLGLVLDDVGGNSLFEGLRSVALTHGEVIEGLGSAERHGIPLIFS